VHFYHRIYKIRKNNGENKNISANQIASCTPSGISLKKNSGARIINRVIKTAVAGIKSV